jgi:hypothetical protein
MTEAAEANFLEGVDRALRVRSRELETQKTSRAVAELDQQI